MVVHVERPKSISIQEVARTFHRLSLQSSESRQRTSLDAGMSSVYEKQRLANIAANHAKLVALGIEAAVADVRSSSVKTQRAAIKGSAINKKKRPTLPTRTLSRRQRNLDVDGKAIPDKPAVPEPAPRQTPRPRSGPLDASKVSTGATSTEDAAAFLARTTGSIVQAGPETKASPSKKVNSKSAATASAPNQLAILDLAKLHIADDDIAKLVPERIFSVEVHPSESILLAAAGDTWGRVGLWDVDASADDIPVATFNPHDKPVAGIRVLPHMPHQLLTCSHDGSVRCLDLAGGASSSFIEMYRAPNDDDGDPEFALHGLSRSLTEGGALLVACGDGATVMLDPRTPAITPAGVVQLHDRKLYCVDVCPSAPWLVASASIDRTVALWDVRKFAGGGKKPKPLETLDHGLAVTAARFSSSGTRLLTTCNDDLLRVYEGASGSTWKLRSSAKHNNNTGRFITSFQAEWVRGSDVEYICGSLQHPRGVDVFHVEEGTQPRLDEEENVTAVVSLFAQHPTRDVLVASNASGKCYVWR